jgi:hypothetical protein
MDFESGYIQNLSPLHVIQPGSKAHGGPFPREKRPRREGEHSPPNSAEFRNMWISTSTPPHVFMV